MSSIGTKSEPEFIPWRVILQFSHYRVLGLEVATLYQGKSTNYTEIPENSMNRIFFDVYFFD